MIKNKYAMTLDENIFCAKRILVDSIYSQANLEGIAVTFAETQDILNNVNVVHVTPKDICKILCLRDGGDYLLTSLGKPNDLVFLETLHELIARFDVPYLYLGKLRTDDVFISGTSCRPELPNADKIIEDMQEISEIDNDTDRAFSLGLYVMRTQPFKDGNKRVGSFLINKVLIENGRGIFNVPVGLDGQFKKQLVDYYETNNADSLKDWMLENCLDGTTLAKEKEEEVNMKLLTAFDKIGGH